MPFDQFVPHPLTAGAIRTYAPTGSGVYGISNAHEWIYIGETDNIQGTLLTHLQQAETPLMSRVPTGFVFETCNRDRRPSRQDRLILEYEPICNRHLSQHTPRPKLRRAVPE